MIAGDEVTSAPTSLISRGVAVFARFGCAKVNAVRRIEADRLIAAETAGRCAPKLVTEIEKSALSLFRKTKLKIHEAAIFHDLAGRFR